MTALAFIVGCLPLWAATGSGAASRRILGTVVVGGMTLSTALGLIFIPVTFAVVEYLSHRFVQRRQGHHDGLAKRPLRSISQAPQPVGAAANEDGRRAGMINTSLSARFTLIGTIAAANLLCCPAATSAPSTCGPT